MAIQTASPPLPIEAVLPEVKAALRHASALVVEAPPGAGKSTRLPLALLDAPWLQQRRIVMLEPRRLAAKSIAYWMAGLLGEAVGMRVGYRVRLDNRVSPDTRIEVVTEGVLTRMLQSDPTLADVGCVIFDEFHERSLNADLGLALCLDSQAQLRGDLRIVVMSATIDAQPIAQWLGDAPVVTAAGRSFPVQTCHLGRTGGARIEAQTTSAVLRALREHEGDVLVFLPGAGEIRRVQTQLTQHLPGGINVLPLYGDLPQAEQERAIAASRAGERKIVLSTSIAETGLTIDGVRVVIDSGLSRRPQFDPRSGMTRLQTTRVSRAAADQRRGRAGRVAPGVCYRLWSEEAERALAAHSAPEIVEADLSALVLELAAWGLDDPTRLRWLTPPPTAAFEQARELLIALGALDARGQVNAHGRAMTELGTHPRLAHMLVRAQESDLEEYALGALACDLAALLGERDLLRLPPDLRNVDMRLRVEALRGIRDHLPPGAVIDRGVHDRASQQAANWRQRLVAKSARGTAMDYGSNDSVGMLLALAYPDRIARLRSGQPGRYQLSNGRGAMLIATDALARSEFIAIAEIDAGDREARIFLAAPLRREALESLYAEKMQSVEQVYWDMRSSTVIARSERRLGHLIIAESPLDRLDPQRSVEAMIAGIRAMGIAALPWDIALRTWQRRVLFLRRHDQAAPAWPDVSDANLEQTLEQWLAPFLSGITRREHLQKLDLRAALMAMLTFTQQRELDAQAPTHIEVPSGSRITLDYGNDDSVVLAARLQELFGMQSTPRIAHNRVAVLIHLLSPARRPVQVTTDLANFWKHGYQEVRKELKGRYPKHYWPEDPFTAVATHRVRPR